MARRVFLHVGTAKSGTSYLQDLWWRHRDELRAQGLLLPGRGRRDHFTAAALVKGMTAVVDDLDRRDREVWRRLVEEARAAGFWKLVSGAFADNAPSRAMLRAVGFREVGIYEHHAQLDGVWRDVVLVELLTGTTAPPPRTRP